MFKQSVTCVTHASGSALESDGKTVPFVHTCLGKSKGLFIFLLSLLFWLQSDPSLLGEKNESIRSVSAIFQGARSAIGPIILCLLTMGLQSQQTVSKTVQHILVDYRTKSSRMREGFYSLPAELVETTLRFFPSFI